MFELVYRYVGEKGDFEINDEIGFVYFMNCVTCCCVTTYEQQARISKFRNITLYIHTNKSNK